MDEITIKSEPIDYDHINTEKQSVLIEVKEANETMFNNYLCERAVVSENLYEINLNSGGIVGVSVTLNNNHGSNSSSIECNVDLMEFMQVLTTAQKKRVSNVNEEHFSCIFKCGGTFRDLNECIKHEIDEAKKIYRNGKLTFKKRNFSKNNVENLIIIPKVDPPMFSINKIDSTFAMTAPVITDIEVKQEIIEDLEPDKDISENVDLNLSAIDTDSILQVKVEVKEESMDEDEPEAVPIPKIKVPASLLNSLKAAQNAQKPDCTFLRTMYKNEQRYGVKPAVEQPQKQIIPPKEPIKETINISLPIPKAILQPITLSNRPLKLNNTNMKILKLPPNTKIVKLHKQILSEKSTITKTMTNDIIKNASPFVQNTKQETLLAETKLKEAIIQENRRQKIINFVPKPTLDMIEQLPESKKAISELLQKVKEAEEHRFKTYMLPKDVQCNDINSKQNLKTHNSDDSNSSLSSTTENRCASIYIEMNGDDSILFRMRRLYPHFRCFWLCPFCPRQYASRNTLRSHLGRYYHHLQQAEIDSLHLEVKIFNLGAHSPEFESVFKTSCTMPFNGTDDTIKKVTNARAKKESFTCKKCGRECSSKVALMDHVAANCSREPQYQCSQCPKKFFSVSTLNCHVTIHTGELPHKCNYCDKRFRTRGQVTVHHRTHTGERPFKCQVCSQSFTHRETLIAHLSRHIGMKRYKCYGCNKQFSCISGLRTHRDTRPETCGKVKFNPRALGPRVRVVKGHVIFEPQPEINPYLRSDSPPEVPSD